MIHNVVLIHPAPRRYSGFLSTHRLPGLVTAHSGLTILAQILQRRGLQVRVLDEQIAPIAPEMLEDADLVGISIQTSWAPQGYRLAATARATGLPVVFGGVHATLNPREAIEHADYVVIGEGEQTLPELIDALDGKRSFDSVLGLVWKEEGRARTNEARPPLDTAALDALPWPRLDLIEGWTDPTRFPINRGIYFTMATRGCDQACTFCSITRVFGRALRHRSVSSMIEELGSRWDPKRQFLFFMDDSLAVDTGFLKALLTALLEHDLVPRLGWHSQMRADVARDPELLALMKATHCSFVTCGFESVDAGSLKVLGKGQSRRDIEQAIARLSENDIIVNGFFVFGTDHDSPDTIAETVRFARRSGCLLAGFMPLTPFPGTPTFAQLDREGRIFTRDWELYDVQHVVFHPRRMSARELYWRTLACYPSFYARTPPLRAARLALRKRATPTMIAIGASWSIVKQLCWAHEVAANLDYIRELHRVSAAGPNARFAEPSDRNLWYKDLVSARAAPRLRSLLP